MTYFTLRRDPFARGELERLCSKFGSAKERATFHERATCATCGQSHKRMFRYRWASDGGRKGEWSRWFCNVQCWEQFQ